MTLLVSFDGSPLAEAALVRATAFASVFDEAVLAVSIVPDGDAAYVRERDWLKDLTNRTEGSTGGRPTTTRELSTGPV